MVAFHVHGQIIGRGQGRSVVSAAAYRSASRLVEYIFNPTTGMTVEQVWDYRKKQKVVFSKICAPDYAPEWVYDREKLWNRVSSVEKRKDSQLCREYDVALPIELTLEQNIALMEEIIQECYVKHGMVADSSFHLDNPKNPHFHVMLTMRKLEEKANGEFDFGLKNREWNKKELLVSNREKIANIINKHLELHGHLARVSHLSHKERGIDLVPSIKVGAAYHIEGSDRRKIQAEIVAENAKRIAENPELVFSKLSINKPVFTKEEIAISLHESLMEVRNEQGKVVRNLNDELAADEQLAELVKIETNEGKVNSEVSSNQEIATEFMIAYSKLMNSPKISLVVREDLKGMELYALTSRLELEKRFIEVVEQLHKSDKHSLHLSEKDLENTEELLEVENKLEGQETYGGQEKNKEKLTQEQKTAVLELVNGSDMVALHGMPGSGKTTVMKEVVRQYKKAGYQIIGVSTSENAAINLGKIAGIKAMNIDQFRKKTQELAEQKFELALRLGFEEEEQYKHVKNLLNNEHVLIVDEASMVELARSHYLNLAAARAGAKIIKLGDNNQLPAIGAAGAFYKECQIVNVSYLTKVRRQRNPQHVLATSLLAQYDIEGFLKIYEEEGSIKLYDSEQQAQTALINDYMDSYLEKAKQLNTDQLMTIQDKVITICAYSNIIVDKLNQLARDQLKQAGILHGTEVVMWDNQNKQLKLMRGEQIIFGRNSKRLGVVNGDIGTVLKLYQIDENNAVITVLIKKSDGSSQYVLIDSRAKYPYKALNYGYAVTIHKVQGVESDEMLVYGEPNSGYEGFMVMMTRHRDKVKVYFVKKELEDVLYQRLGEDADLVRELNEVIADQPLWRVGLVLSMHKRANISLATDYISMGLSEEDKVVKNYIEARGNLVKIIREIVSWQDRQVNLIGKRPGMWENNRWQQVVDYRDERQSNAKIICNNYPAYQQRIIQLNLNYQTIKKHAGLTDAYQVDKLSEAYMLGNSKYQELIGNLKIFSELDLEEVKELVKQQLLNKWQEKDNSAMAKLEIDEQPKLAVKAIAQEMEQVAEQIENSKVGKVANKIIGNFTELLQDIDDLTIDIEALEVMINDVMGRRYVLEDNISYLERRNQSLPELLRRIYINDPSAILERWQGLIEKEGVERGAKLVRANPKMLSDLRGMGLGSWFGFDYNRKVAIANISNLSERLQSYHDSREKIAEYQLLAKGEAFREGELIKECMILRRSVPNQEEKRLFKQISKILKDKQLKSLTISELVLLQEIASSDFVQDEALAVLVKQMKGEDKNFKQEQQDRENSKEVRRLVSVDKQPAKVVESSNKIKGGRSNNNLEQASSNVELLLTKSTLKISQLPVVANSGEDKQHLLARSKEEIINDNIQKIKENPWLVFDQIPIYKVVFSKEDMEVAVYKALLEVRDGNNQLIDKMDIEEDKEQIIAAQSELTHQLMSSEEVVLACLENLRGEKLFAFKQVLELEENFIEVVQELNSRFNHKLVVDKQGKKEKELSNQQRQAVTELLQGADIVALEGLFGSGKSVVIKEVVKQLTKANKLVIGMAVNSKIALDLAEATGIEARNLAQWRRIWQIEAGEEFTLELSNNFYNESAYQHGKTMLTNQHVLIVDKAGMINLVELYYLLLEAKKATAKVILVGDNNQIAAIGKKGGFKKIGELIEVSRLTQIIRQKNLELLKVTNLLSQYRIGESLDILDKQGCIIMEDSDQAAKEHLINDYINSYIEKVQQLDRDNLVSDLVICTHTNDVVDQLNNSVRDQLKQICILKGEEVEVKLGDKNLKLMIGEQIIFGQNSKILGITSGEVATVLEIQVRKDGEVLIVGRIKNQDGNERPIVISSVSNYHKINYAYAVTVYKLRGVEKVFVLFDKMAQYEAFVMMMTRYKEQVKLYANGQDLRNLVFRNLAEDIELSRELYNIDSKTDLGLIGLGLSVHRRTNLSFVGDYKNMGNCLADKQLKKYLQAKAEFAGLMQDITKWQVQQNSLTGSKPKLSEHAEWEKVLLVRDTRDEMARIIVDNYNSFAQRLLQHNINFQIVLKHAGRREYDYQVSSRHQEELSNEHWLVLLDSLSSLKEQGNKFEEKTLGCLSQSFASLQVDLQVVRDKLTIVDQQLIELLDNREKQQSQIRNAERFNEILLPHFLQKIYKNASSKSASLLVIKNWQELVGKYGVEEAAAKVKRSPELLGEVTNYTGNSLQEQLRNRDIALYVNKLTDHLQKYEESELKLQSNNNLLNNPGEIKQMQELFSSKIELEKQLPNYQERKLLDLIGDKLNNSQCNKEDGSLVIELQAIAASDVGKQIILNRKNKVRVQLEVNKGVGKEIEFLLTRSTLKIGKELVIIDKEQVNQLLSNKLKMEIISDNIEKVRENPRLVFSRIPPDKPVFDQEGLQIAVNEVLLEIRDKKGQVIGKIDIADTLDNKEASKEESSVVNQQLAAAGSQLCEYLISNEEVVLVCQEDLQGKRLFAFRQTLELEEKFMEVVQELNKSFNHKLVVGSADNKDRILKQNRVLSEKRGLTLSNQQRQVVEELLQGADIVALEGLPGSGKSTVMREVVKQLTEFDRVVIGTAPSSKASLNLAAVADIEVKNLAQWRKMWQTEAGQQFTLELSDNFYKKPAYQHDKTMLTNQHVLIIDEAGMVNLAELYYMLLEVKKASAKVILVGDNNQFAAIGRKGGFKKVCEMVQVSRLTEVMRQDNAKLAMVNSLISNYCIRDALDSLHEQGCLIVHDSEQLAKEHLVNDYIDSYLENARQLGKDGLVSKFVMCGHTNKAVGDLNEKARYQLKQAGILEGKEIEVKLKDKSLKLMRGEQIIFGQNSGKLGVINGEIATVLEVTEKQYGEVIITCVINNKDGSKRYVEINSLDNYDQIDYAYAVTIYKLQGITVERTFALFEKMMGYEAFLVMITRHRKLLRVYANNLDLEGLVFKRLAKDEEEVRKLCDVSQDDVVGLGFAVHKKANLGFASSYQDIGKFVEDEQLKIYLWVRAEIANITREIAKWQVENLNALGEKQKASEHSRWEELCGMLEERGKLAEIIVFDYPSFEELLPKYNVNFQTVLKHAGAKEYSYGVSSKDLERSNNKHWLALLEHIVSLDTREEEQLLVEEGLDKARRLVAIVREDLQVVKGKLARVEKQLTELINNRDKQQRELINAKRFTGKLLPYFLQERYKNAPSLIIKNWQELISDLGVAKAIKKVEKNPSLLGKVNKYAGDSVENKLTNEGVVANKCKLIDSLQEYENSKLTIQSSNKLLDNEVEEVSKEKTKLRTLLLNHQEQKMLNLMDEILNKSQLAKDTNNITECLRSIATYQGRVIDEFISHGEYQDREQKEINLEQEEINLNKQKEISLEQEEINLDKQKEMHPEVQKVLDSLNESKKLPSRNIGKSNNPLYQELILKRMVESKLESDISFEELSQGLTREDFANLFSSYVMNINPNGKIRRQSNQISCGSVNMNLDNGLWYRFSTGDKGNIFSFVAQAKNIKESQALKLIVRAFGFVKIGGELKRIGNDDSSFWTSDINQDITSDIKQDITYKQASSEEQWVAFKIVPKEAESFNAEKHLSYVLKNNSLETIYKYCNIDNQLIGYTVRLIEKNGDGKQVLPVSYCRDDQSNEQKWCLKGFTDDLGNKPIYGAEKLANRDVPVLIVEGEKTANIAQGLLPEYSVISWLGGSKTAGKVNWQILAGRRVVIWPDNDQPGFAAARAIQQKLQGVANCCMVVDPRVLAVANKWDLGDTIPANVNIRSALVTHHHPQSIEIVDQQIRALNYHDRNNEQLSNEQLISLLEEQAIAWLQQEGKDNDQYQSRLDHELTVISQTGFAKDFIIAANIAKYCNHMHIAIGPGRGSAVSSLVAYILGIHEVDPVENKLLFGRFLTEKTTSNPDFDFDIASTQKILVENYLLAKYSNATKLAVVNNRGDKAMTIHPAGIGIVPDTIKDQLPYSTISGHYWNDRPLLAIDHKQAEQLGVKKFDLLSSHVAESLQRAENLLQADNQAIDWINIAWHDQKTFELINSANTEGVHQLGSEFAKTVCQQVRIEKFADLINIVALIRPSTKDYVQYFAKNVIDSNNFSDPKNVFKDTRNIPLFQEQIMQASHYYLGIAKSETNQFRKELEKDDSNHPLLNKDNFIGAAIGNGLDTKDALKLYQLMQKFSKFSYNKSHAIAYTQLTFKTAYIKAHHYEIFQETFKIKKSTSKNNIKIKPVELEQLSSFQASTQTIDPRDIEPQEEPVIITQVAANELSFIEVSRESNSNITIIADNLDNALAIKQAGINAKILSAQSVSNINNYQPTEGERIIIASNNEGANAPSLKAIEEAKKEIEQKGAIVDIIAPPLLGDFNDILQKHADNDIAGKAEISKLFAPIINAVTAKTLEEYFSYVTLRDHEIEQINKSLAYIRKYNVTEDKILAGFKHSSEYGIQELARTVENLQAAEKMVLLDYSDLLVDIQVFAGKVDQQLIISKLANKHKLDRSLYLQDIRVDALHQYITTRTNSFAKAKEQCEKLEDVLSIVSTEQEFLGKLLRDHQEAMKFYGFVHYPVYEAAMIAEQKPYLMNALTKVTNKAKEQEVRTELEIIETLKSNQNAETTYKIIDQACEAHHITTNLANFNKEKEQAQTSREMLQTITQEQEFLSSLHGNLKYEDYDQNLLILIEQADKRRNDDIINQLCNIVQQALKNGVKSEEQIMFELKTITNIEVIQEGLDRCCEAHHITTNLAAINEEQEHAKTPVEILKAIGQEQNFLSNLHGKLKYFDYDKNLLMLIEQSDKYKKDNIIEQLRDIVQKALSKGVKTEGQIVIDLRSTPNLAASYENLDRDCEVHHINTNLELLAKSKEEAKSPEEILNAIEQKQKFLSSLHNNLKYNNYQPSLLNSINQAFKQQKDHVMDDLQKAINHVMANGIIPEQELIKCLETTEDIHITEKKLRRTCEDHHIAYINKNLHQLETLGHLKIGDNIFTSESEYIRHEIKNPAHDFASSPRMMKVMKQYERKLELQGPNMSM